MSSGDNSSKNFLLPKSFSYNVFSDVVLFANVKGGLVFVDDVRGTVSGDVEFRKVL